MDGSYLATKYIYIYDLISKKNNNNFCFIQAIYICIYLNICIIIKKYSPDKNPIEKLTIFFS